MQECLCQRESAHQARVALTVPVSPGSPRRPKTPVNLVEWAPSYTEEK